MAIQDTTFFNNLFKAVRDFNRDPGRDRTIIGNKIYYKKDTTKLLKRLPQFKTYWNISNEDYLIRKVYTDFWVERNKDLALLTDRQEPILTPQAHQEFEEATKLPEPQKEQALNGWLDKHFSPQESSNAGNIAAPIQPPAAPENQQTAPPQVPTTKPLPPTNPLAFISKPPEVIKQAALNTASTSQIRFKRWLSRIKPGAILSYIGQEIFGGGTTPSLPTTLPSPLPPSASPAPLTPRSEEKAYPIGSPAYHRFETPSFLKNIASNLQIRAGRVISRYGKLKFITSLAFGGAGGGLAVFSGASPLAILGSSALGFSVPSFITSRIGGGLLRGGGGLAFKAGSKAALGAAGPVGWGVLLLSSGTFRKIIKWIAAGIGAFVLFFLIQNPFGLSKGTALLMLPEYGEAAPYGGDPPILPPPNINGITYSCPVGSGSIQTFSYWAQGVADYQRHCRAAYIGSSSSLASICALYKGTYYAIDVGGSLGQNVTIPYVVDPSTKSFKDGLTCNYIGASSGSYNPSQIITQFTCQDSINNRSVWLQFHHMQRGYNPPRQPLKSGDTAGRIALDDEGYNHAHIQMGINGSCGSSVDGCVSAEQYLQCGNYQGG